MGWGSFFAALWSLTHCFGGYSSQIVTRASSQELDNLVKGVVGLTIGGFDLGQGCGCFRRSALKKAVREGSTHALMEENKHQGDAGSLVSEAIGIVVPVVFEQSVTFHLTYVVAQLGEGVGSWGETEA